MKGQTRLWIEGSQDYETLPEITVYDFKRPDKFSMEQLRTLQFVFETFSRLACSELSNALKLKTEIKVNSVDQLTFGEFTLSIPETSCLGIIEMSPLLGSTLLQMDPVLYSSMLNRMYGGTGQSEKPFSQLSRLESQSMEQMYDKLLFCLQESWQPMMDLSPNLAAIENHIQFAQIVPPVEMCILVSMECSLEAGDQKVCGYINVCIPFLTIEPMIERLSASYWFSEIIKDRSPRPPMRVLPDLPLETRLYYQSEAMPLEQIYRISTGEAFELNPDKPYILEAGGEALLEWTEKEKGLLQILEKPENDSIEQILSPPTKETRPQGILEQFSLELKESLNSFSKNMETRLIKLEESQQELNNRLVYQEPGEETPELLYTQTRPFSFVRKEDCSDLFLISKNENSQAMAVMMSYLDPDTAACLLARYSSEKQVDLIQRITTLDRMAPRILDHLENYIHGELKRLSSQQIFQAGGVQSSVEILNRTPRAVEKNVIESLLQRDKAMAKSLMQNMFVFEDCVLLDPKALQSLFARVEEKDLVLALRMVDEEVKSHLLSIMDKEKQKKIISSIEELGRVRITQVEAAQMRIVHQIKEMEESGEIIVGRPDELV